MSEFFQRILTFVALIILLISIYFYASNMVLYFIIITISIISLNEWLSLNKRCSLWALVPFLFILYLMTLLDIRFFIVSLSIIFWIYLFILLLRFPSTLRKQIERHHAKYGYLIMIIFTYQLLYFYPDDNALNITQSLYENKRHLFQLILIATLIDSYGYIFGKLFGKNKVVVQISPNKTLEGYLGAIIFTLLTLATVAFIMDITWTFIDTLFLVLLIIFAFLGDLFISFVKRIYNAKDTGNILPGHGGILDRIDSYLPILCIYNYWLLI